MTDIKFNQSHRKTAGKVLWELEHNEIFKLCLDNQYIIIKKVYSTKEVHYV